MFRSVILRPCSYREAKVRKLGTILMKLSFGEIVLSNVCVALYFEITSTHTKHFCVYHKRLSCKLKC